MNIVNQSATYLLVGLCALSLEALAEPPTCLSRNWNHGTQQVISLSIPPESKTKQIVISVENLDDNEFQGSCPSSVPYPPTDTNNPHRRCTPSKFADMTVEWVRDLDEGDQHTVSIEIKNGNNAPPRTVKACVRYQK